jgi:hypothetical protein
MMWARFDLQLLSIRATKWKEWCTFRRSNQALHVPQNFGSLAATTSFKELFPTYSEGLNA